jgi:hypothetical protein
MSFNRFSLWLLVSKIKERVKICAFIIGVTFLTVLILHVSPVTPDAPNRLNR